MFVLVSRVSYVPGFWSVKGFNDTVWTLIVMIDVSVVIFVAFRDYNKIQWARVEY